MGKEWVSTGASIVVILAALAGVAVQMGAMQAEIKAKEDAIAVLRVDVRELRDGWTRHLESHVGESSGDRK